MTFFKDKLDKELGEAPRFSQPLQKRILQHVQHKKKKKSAISNNNYWGSRGDTTAVILYGSFETSRNYETCYDY